MKVKKSDHSPKSQARSIVCPKCGHYFPLPDTQISARVAQASRSLNCAECGKPIVGEPLSFSGRHACEGCVTAYYKAFGAEVVAQEIRERKVAAVTMWKGRRR